MTELDAPRVSRPPESRAAWVTDELRDSILSGFIPPGEQLRPRDLERRYGVSATPVREAIQRLAAERLVQIAPHRHATVVALDVDELEHIYELRLLLEPIAVTRSLERSDSTWLAEVEAAHATLVDYGQEHSPASIYAHLDFHGRIRSRCDSPWMLRFIDELVMHSERYRALRMDPNRFEAVSLEHAMLVDACLDGDGPRLAELTHAHIKGTLDTVRRRLASGADSA